MVADRASAVAMSPGEEPAALRSREYILARAEDEIIRARRAPSTFAWIRIEARDATQRQRATMLVAEQLRIEDPIAASGTCSIEVLLLGVQPQQTELVASRMTAHLRRHDVPHELSAAAFPRDGASCEQIRQRLSRQRVIERPVSKQPAEPEGLVNEGSQLSKVYELARRAGRSDLNVLLVGETGVGKEILAGVLHRNSSRAHAPLLRLNCATFTEGLLESELFGYRKGAFTGATEHKQGLLEAACGGTVFLDEVTELSLNLQAKLLTVIEHKRFLPLGSLTEHSVDVRFIAACNRDLECAVRARSFRQDLFYRLNGFTIRVPPLRERLDEIESLAHHFSHQAKVKALHVGDVRIDSDVLALLRRHRWPGNVRELRNVMHRAVMLAGDCPIKTAHIVTSSLGHVPGHSSPEASSVRSPGDSAAAANDQANDQADQATDGEERDSPGSATGEGESPPHPALEPQRRRDVLAALAACAGNQTRAAELLGVSRRTLCNWLDRYRVPRPRKPSRD